MSKIKDEKRKIVFRDDNYSIDSKSRLSEIEPEIPLDANELLRALKDAIKNSKKKKSVEVTVNKAESIAKVEPDLEPIEEDEDIDDIPVEETVAQEETATETSDYPDDLAAVIRTMFKECTDKDKKANVRKVIAEYGKLNDVDENGLKRIYDMMN